MSPYVRPAETSDAVDLAPRLREADCLEVRMASGKEPEEVLREALEASDESWAACSPDGEVFALYGAIFELKDHKGRPLGVAVPWLLGSPKVRTYIRQILRAAPDYLRMMAHQNDTLVQYVHAEHQESVRFLEHLGFQVVATEQRYGAGRVPFHLMMKTNV